MELKTTIPHPVSMQEWKRFKKEYKEKYPHLRLGQAFLNIYFPKLSFPEAYYEHNTEVIEKRLIQKGLIWPLY